jgi:hypothetical protein
MLPYRCWLYRSEEFDCESRELAELLARDLVPQKGELLSILDAEEGEASEGLIWPS